MVTPRYFAASTDSISTITTKSSSESSHKNAHALPAVADTQTVNALSLFHILNCTRLPQISKIILQGVKPEHF